MDKMKLCKILRNNAEKVWEHKNLCGMCAICALAVEKAFEKHGYKCKSYCGIYLVSRDYGESPRNHCWTECDDLIYDITATQFDDANLIVITNVNDRRYHVKNDVLNLYKESYWRKWPSEQRPSEQIISRLLEGTSA